MGTGSASALPLALALAVALQLTASGSRRLGYRYTSTFKKNSALAGFCQCQ